MDVWFDKYYPEQYPKNQDQMCISTHYTVEYDLSREPLLEDKIISKEFNDKLPVNIHDEEYPMTGGVIHLRLPPTR